MALNIDKSYKYANPYNTNRDYLRNMTSLQMKALGKMIWYDLLKYIIADLWVIPWASFSKEDVEDSMELFIDMLNKELMRL